MMRLLTAVIVCASLTTAALGEEKLAPTTLVFDAETGQALDILDVAAGTEAYEGRRLRFENVLLGNAQISGVAWLPVFYDGRPLDMLAVDLPDSVSPEVKKWLFLTCSDWGSNPKPNCMGDVEGVMAWNGRLKEALVEAYTRAARPAG